MTNTLRDDIKRTTRELTDQLSHEEYKKLLLTCETVEICGKNYPTMLSMYLGAKKILLEREKKNV